MKKSFAFAKGELLMFLNIGNYFPQTNVMETAFEPINRNEADINYTDNVQVNDQHETYVRIYDHVLTLDFWKMIPSITRQWKNIAANNKNKIGYGWRYFGEALLSRIP
jgi:hypothetical protein